MAVVNGTFDHSKYNPFLRYNESWFFDGPDKAAATGTKLAKDRRVFPKIYQSHIPGGAAAALDWRYSASVAPLVVNYPKLVSYKRIPTGGHCISEPIQTDFANVIVLGYPGIRPPESTQHRINSCFYSLSKSGLLRHRFVVNDNGTEELVRRPVNYDRSNLVE